MSCFSWPEALDDRNPGSGGKSFKLVNVDGDEGEVATTAADDKDCIEDVFDFDLVFGRACAPAVLLVAGERMLTGDIKPRAASIPSTPVGVAAAAATAAGASD